MSEQLFCIEHGKMVKAECEPICGHVQLIRVVGEIVPEVDFCEFPLGYAFCPPPEFDMDEFMEVQVKQFGENYQVVESDFLPYTYDVERDEIVQEVLI